MHGQKAVGGARVVVGAAHYHSAAVDELVVVNMQKHGHAVLHRKAESVHAVLPESRAAFKLQIQIADVALRAQSADDNRARPQIVLEHARRVKPHARLRRFDNNRHRKPAVRSQSAGVRRLQNRRQRARRVVVAVQAQRYHAVHGVEHKVVAAFNYSYVALAEAAGRRQGADVQRGVCQSMIKVAAADKARADSAVRHRHQHRQIIVAAAVMVVGAAQCRRGDARNVVVAVQAQSYHSVHGRHCEIGIAAEYHASRFRPSAFGDDGADIDGAVLREVVKVRGLRRKAHRHRGRMHKVKDDLRSRRLRGNVVDNLHRRQLQSRGVMPEQRRDGQSVGAVSQHAVFVDEQLRRAVRPLIAARSADNVLITRIRRAARRGDVHRQAVLPRLRRARCQSEHAVRRADMKGVANVNYHRRRDGVGGVGGVVRFKDNFHQPRRARAQCHDSVFITQPFGGGAACLQMAQSD